MGMWPTATLTYGYDIESATGDWYEDEEPVEAGGQILHDAGLPKEFGVWQDYGGRRMRLFATFLQASGYNDQGKAETLELPAGTDEGLRRAADVLGIDLGDAKPSWLLLAEFN
jgi:hypothetical protein